MRVHIHRGFSLVEMLVALLIMSAAAAFLATTIGTIKSIRDASYENAAFHIAGNKLEDLRAGGYDALPSSGSFSDPGLASLPEGMASTSVSDMNEKTKNVSVSVSWSGSDGATHIVSLTTLMTQVGGL